MQCKICHKEFDKNTYRPEMFFTPPEEKSMEKCFNPLKGKFVILWGLSGSSRNKTYPTPYMFRIVGELLKKHQDIVFITVGDENCQILETSFQDKRIIKKSGVWSMRESILACKYASLVISPDTGLLHGVGCFDTPKLGLLTHTTIENITKHFVNDYSLEADVSCAPCFRIVYQTQVCCPLAVDNLTPVCMWAGLPVNKVIEQVERIKNEKEKI